jgi:hypothetical protein
LSDGVIALIISGFVSISVAFIAQAAGLAALWMKQRQTQDAVEHNTAVTQTVHALVNNAMGVQLLTTANALDKAARATRDPRDVKEAADARRLYDEHIRGQAALNEAVQEKINPPKAADVPEVPPHPMH